MPRQITHPRPTPPRVVLASRSPSRARILRAAGWEPTLMPADIDEAAVQASLDNAPPSGVVAELARAKAHGVADRLVKTDADSLADGSIVIGCDSMLLIDGELQGKPHTVERAVERWIWQAGQTAELLTGHCILGPAGEEVCRTISTTVHFASADRRDIEAYAASGEPLECAGAFTLEALGGWFIDRIEGDASSVLGLSLPLVRDAVYSFGWPVSAWWA